MPRERELSRGILRSVWYAADIDWLQRGRVDEKTLGAVCGRLVRDGVDGACFINNDGSKTALYSYTKRIIAEMQKFAKVAFQYEYENNYLVYAEGKQKSDFDYLTYAEETDKPPFEITIDRALALVTEQRSDKGKLFMIENVGNVKDELFGNEPAMQVVCKLPAGKKTFYHRGKKIRCKESNGRYTFNLKVGEAVFVEIKN